MAVNTLGTGPLHTTPATGGTARKSVGALMYDYIGYAFASVVVLGGIAFPIALYVYATFIK